MATDSKIFCDDHYYQEKPVYPFPVAFAFSKVDVAMTGLTDVFGFVI